MTTTTDGTVADGFEAVADAFQQNFTEHAEVGAAAHVRIDGRVVVDLWGGHVDATESATWRPDTLVNVYSVGKAFGATLVLQLVDDGLIGLDDPVADHWPAFAEPAVLSTEDRELSSRAERDHAVPSLTWAERGSGAVPLDTGDGPTPSTRLRDHASTTKTIASVRRPPTRTTAATALSRGGLTSSASRGGRLRIL